VRKNRAATLSGGFPDAGATFSLRPISMKKRYILLSILLALLAVGVFFFFYYDLSVYLTDRQKAIRLLKSFGPWSFLVFIPLQTLQVIMAPFPGEVTGFIGGYIYGTILGTLYSTIGLTIGSWIAFTLARIYGLPLVEKIVAPGTVRKYDTFMRHQGILVSFVLFLIPGFPKDSLCYIMGLSHIPTTTFLLLSTIGRLFGTILLSVGGSLARDRQTEVLFVVFALSGLTLLLAYIYRDRILLWLKKREGPPPPVARTKDTGRYDEKSR